MDKSRHQFVIYGSIGIDSLIPFMKEAANHESSVSFGMSGVFPDRIEVTVCVYGAGIARKRVPVIPILKKHGGKIASVYLNVYDARRPFDARSNECARYKKVLS